MRRSATSVLREPLERLTRLQPHTRAPGWPADLTDPTANRGCTGADRGLPGVPLARMHSAAPAYRSAQRSDLPRPSAGSLIVDDPDAGEVPPARRGDVAHWRRFAQHVASGLPLVRCPRHEP
jgi:hypothetical protein